VSKLRAIGAVLAGGLMAWSSAGLPLRGSQRRRRGAEPGTPSPRGRGKRNRRGPGNQHTPVGFAKRANARARVREVER
jgi:hypothetical protein